MEEPLIPYCTKINKPMNQILKGECPYSCSDRNDGKPCEYFVSITEKEISQRWRH
jgi:hypothetical protein